MKKLLNTLYVTTQGAYLAKDGECVAVRVDNEVRLRVPCIPSAASSVSDRFRAARF
jgi:zona occludens toxin (predicted ATPase)